MSSFPGEARYSSRSRRRGMGEWGVLRVRRVER